jgi:hypothetical protein
MEHLNIFEWFVRNPNTTWGTLALVLVIATVVLKRS